MDNRTSSTIRNATGYFVLPNNTFLKANKLILSNNNSTSNMKIYYSTDTNLTTQTFSTNANVGWELFNYAVPSTDKITDFKFVGDLVKGASYEATPFG